MGEFRRLFPNDSRYNVRLDHENEGTWVARAIFDRDRENSLALELGEFFYQLRAALDAAIWEGVSISEGAEPTTHTDRLEFPICSDSKSSTGKEKFEKAAIHKVKFSEELRDWMATIQPYSAMKPVNHPDCGLSVTLECLHNCARKDRHRRLHVTAAVAERIDWEFIDLPPGVHVGLVEPVPADFLKGDDVFLRFRLEGALIEPTIKPKLATTLQIDIAVDEIPKWSDEGFWVELKRFGVAVEHVIDRFESVYAKLP